MILDPDSFWVGLVAGGVTFLALRGLGATLAAIDRWGESDP